MNAFHDKKVPDISDQCSCCCIKIDGLSVNYGREEVLKNIDLHLHCGELTAIIGPNGAGKSTLFKAIIGEIPYSGILSFVDGNNKEVKKPRIGYVPQKVHFNPEMPATVLDFILAGKSSTPIWLYRKKNLRQKTIELLSRARAEHLISKKLGNLSGGELQRVLLAMALHPSPNLLLLDEPSQGIDQEGLEMFYRIVSEIRHSFDLSVLLITHDLSLVAKYADRIILLDKEIKFNGTYNNLKSQKEIIGQFGKNWPTGIFGMETERDNL